MTSINLADLSAHNLTVIGAGTMGHGIAGQAARCGAQVKLYDTNIEALERGLSHIERSYNKAIQKGKMSAEEVEVARARISLASLEGEQPLSRACEGATLVIEAAPERLDLKRKIFAEVEEVVSEQTLLATNTSSLSIDKIAEGLKHP